MFAESPTTGCCVSVGFITVGLATSLLLLPKRVRDTQVIRAEEAETGAIDTGLRGPGHRADSEPSSTA